MKNLLPYVLLTFSIHTNAQFAKLYDFPATINPGGGPLCSVISDGTFLYCPAYNGGSNGDGAIYKIKPDGTGFTDLFDFTAASSGSSPRSALYYDGTFLYGMTSNGGANNKGTIFKLKPDGTGFVKLMDFSGTADGAGARSAFVSDGTYLYGTTQAGGATGDGTIFKIKPDGTGFTKLFDFTTSGSGSTPGSLYYDGAFLYGTAQMGGANQTGGTIFKIKPDGTGFVKLHDFDITNGSQPRSSLISDGTFLYGTTQGGGPIGSGSGNVFKIKPDGTAYTNLLTLTATTGQTPLAGLTLVSSELYGVTTSGGTSGYGTLFKIKTDGTNFIKLVDFDLTTGCGDLGSLFYDGTSFYGGTPNGGANQGGTLFKYTDGITGIAQVQSSAVGFLVYPDPANDYMIIETGSANEQTIKLFDMCGRCFINKSIKGQAKIETSDLKEGVYTLNLQAGNELLVKKIVIVH